MAKGISLHIGLNSVDPERYSGWAGPLNACENDAKDMQALAKASKFTTQILLTKDATRANVIKAIKSAAKLLSKNDMFLLTYSGHGGQLPDKNGDEPDGVDETWCLFDGQLIDDEMGHLWKNFAAGVRVLMISDSCHSGSVAKALMDVALQNEVTKPCDTPRFMPAEIAQSVYLRNREYYDKIIDKSDAEVVEREGEPDKYHGLLISGCQDVQVSYDGVFNGAFTGQLKIVWNGGLFKGDYVEFHKNIVSRLTRQTPNYFRFGAQDGAFDKLKPFTLG